MGLNLFNEAWYLRQNPDVAEAVRQGYVTAREHFELFGNAEGRSASPLFDPSEYLRNNPDVAQAVSQGNITAWDHFELFGSAEGRSPTPLFDANFYLQQNPDVAEAVARGEVASAVQHFLLYGQGEPRAINPAIDLGKYLAANPDVAAAAFNRSINPLFHLLEAGVSEGRNLGNGISLSLFKDDPTFTEALAAGNVGEALLRVNNVAPFLPGFERPTGWTPQENTPIPTNFTPPPGLKLVVPSEINIPANLTLPDMFTPVATTPIPPPQSNGSGTGNNIGGGGSGQGGNEIIAKTFDLAVETYSNDFFRSYSYEFIGNTDGDITITINNDRVVTFIRDGITASRTVDLNDQTINFFSFTLRDGQKLVMTEDQANKFTVPTDQSGAPLYGALNIQSFWGSLPGTLKIDAPVITKNIDLSFLGMNTNIEFGTDNDELEIAANTTLKMVLPDYQSLVFKGAGSVDISAYRSSSISDPKIPATLDVRTTGVNTVSGADANDTILTGNGTNAIRGGPGGDQIILNGGVNTLSFYVGHGPVYTPAWEAEASEDYGKTIVFTNNFEVFGSYISFSYNGVTYTTPTISDDGTHDYEALINSSIAQAKNSQGEPLGKNKIVGQSSGMGMTFAFEAVGDKVKDTFENAVIIAHPDAGFASESYALRADDPNIDVISGFNAGVDKIMQIGGFGFSEYRHAFATQDSFSSGTGIDGLEIYAVNNGIVQFNNASGSVDTSQFDSWDVILAALNAAGTNRFVTAVHHGNDTFLIRTNGASGAQTTDVVIKLQGVLLESVDASFIF